jgi:outer membrane protein insertion porin family/translocation and assembly module TamA
MGIVAGGSLRRLSFLVLVLAAPMGLYAQDVTCDEPDDIEVRRLIFEGNRTFSDAQLAAGIVTTPSSALYRRIRALGTRRCLDKAQLPLDSLRLVVFYENHGFFDTGVGLDTTTLGKGAIEVKFTINEGEPIRLDTLRVEGLNGLPDSARIVRDLPLRLGDRYDKDAIARAKSYVTTTLQNSGYPDADVLLASAGVDLPTRSGYVVMNVLPGVRARIGRIDINALGEPVTEPAQIDEPVIRRLLGIKPGDLYSAQRLIEARRFLFQTGAYRHVDIQLANDSTTSPEDTLVTVRVTVIESELRDIRAGIGWGTLDCLRVQATATDRNFVGGARQLELNARLSKIGIGHPLDGAENLCTGTVKRDPYSDTLNYRVSATLRQPGLFGLGPRNTPSLTGYSEQRSEYRAYFRSVPIGGVASLTRELRRGLSLGLSYQLEYGRTEAQPAIYCAVFNICGEAERARVGEKQQLAVAAVSLSRDRAPAAVLGADGTTFRLDLRHASKTILSDPTLEFNTFLGDIRRYWGFNNGVEIATRLYGGAVVGSRFSEEVSQYVPPQERLYGGGPNSVRGFRFNELGPIAYVVEKYDTVNAPNGDVYYRAPEDAPWRAVPIGGNTLLVMNLEARLPSPFLRDLLRYAVFVDAGEVWNRSSDAASSGWDKLHVTPGAGIRISSPVGAIRVDVGYNGYNRPKGIAYYTFRGDDATGPAPSAPLYCVSPENTRPVLNTNPPTQQENAGDCEATFAPSQARSWLQRLTFNFSIGSAF